VDRLGEELLARAALAGDQDREGVGAGLERLALEALELLAFPDDAVEGVARRAQGNELLLVELELGLEQRELARQLADVAHVLEHDLAEDGDHLPVLLDRDALDHHFLALDELGVVDLGLAGFGHDVHAAVLDGLRAVAPDLGRGIASEELPVVAVEVRDIAVGVGHHRAAVDALEDELVDLQLPPQFVDVGGFVCAGHWGKPGRWG
jgi:hypothetical protein